MKPYKNLKEVSAGLRAAKSGCASDTIFMAKCMHLLLRLLAKVASKRKRRHSAWVHAYTLTVLLFIIYLTVLLITDRLS